MDPLPADPRTRLAASPIGAMDKEPNLGVDTAWRHYLRWNTAVAEEIFSESAAGRPVYLDLEPEVLARIRDRVNVSNTTDPSEALLRAVRVTLLRVDAPHSIFCPHLRATRAWLVLPEDTPPPAIALLAAFSLVAENMERTEQLGASNYYGRLTDALAYPREHKDKVARDYRNAAPILWESLNSWLRDCEGRRGLPTAFAFDRRVYVGLAMSQALVRAQDRRRLPQLFIRYGLQPGQTLSLEEMRELLEDWIPNSQVTPSLRRLWKKQGAKDQIADVACSELEGWDGSLPEDLRPEAALTPVGLNLAAQVRSRPIQSIEFLAIITSALGLQPGAVEVNAAGSSAAERFIKNDGGPFSLYKVPGTGWLELRGAGEIPASALLAANITVHESRSGRTASRGARRLVVMKWDESQNLYLEARRTELLEPYLLLVHYSIADDVRKNLEYAARPGYREHDQTHLQGLPASWIAFDRVQLENIPNVDKDDLAPLQPLARTHVALGGGFALPGAKTWHVDRPPELRVVASEQAAAVEVRDAPMRLIEYEEPPDETLGVLSSGGIINLETSEVAKLEGDHRVIVKSQKNGSSSGRVLATATYRLRSGSTPRLLPGEENQQWLGHLFDSEGTLAGGGATRTQSYCSTPQLVGPVFLGELPRAEWRCTAWSGRIPERPYARIPEETHGSPSAPQPTSPANTDYLSPCLARGHHVWRLDPVDPDYRRRPAHVYQYCTECGLESWHQTKRRRSRRKKATPAREPTAHKPSRLSLPRISEREAPDIDLLLDALAYARGGPWRTLESIAVQADDAPWFPREVARDLSALGHIEFECNPFDMMPRTWHVVPPTLVSNSRGERFLCGERSRQTLEAIRQAVQKVGGEMSQTTHMDAPTIVRLQALSADSLRQVVTDLRHQHRISCHYAEQPELEIARRLPTLDQIRECLPDLTVTRDAESRLDLSAGRWIECARLEEPGAYRLRGRPVTYAVVPPESADTTSISRIADVRTAKYLAAKDARISLLGYDPSTESLLTPFGAPLPGLLERAAVLCSGQLPHPRNDGYLEYSKVPYEVACALSRCCS